MKRMIVDWIALLSSGVLAAISAHVSTFSCCISFLTFTLWLISLAKDVKFKRDYVDSLFFLLE